MSSDNATPVPGPAHEDLDRLPRIVRVTAARRRYPTPKAYVAADAVAYADAGIHVDLYTDEEFAIRAEAPVLFVGGHALTESERVGPKHYRFHGLSPEAQLMRKGAVLQLSWSSSPREVAVRIKKAEAVSRARPVTLPTIEGE